VITLAVIKAFSAVIRAVFGLIPNLGLPSFDEAIGAVGDARVWRYLAWVNHYLPVSLGLALLGIRVTLWLALNLVDLLNWVLVKIHIAGGSG